MVCRDITIGLSLGVPGDLCQQKVREQVIAGAAGPVNTTVLYNGVDSQMFSPPESDAGAVTVLSVGNLIPTKGHDLLVRAFAAIQDRLPAITAAPSLEIIGDGPDVLVWSNWLKNWVSVPESIFEGGKVVEKLRTQCAARLYSPCPAAMRDWDACIWKPCQLASLSLRARGRVLRK